MNLGEWNDRYRSREEIDDHPAAVLVDAARDLVPGRALDLACGAGRNAIWLARRGWEVVAIDGAEEAIPLFAEAKRVVRRGGSVVATARMSGTYAIAPGEMHGWFEDFEIVHEREGEIAEIMARKPDHFIHSNTR